MVWHDMFWTTQLCMWRLERKRNYKLVQLGAQEIGMVCVMTKVTTLGLITFVAIGGQVTIIDIDD